MGHIKEPKGIDFVINSGPLTKKQEDEVSKYISEYKAKSKSKKINKLKTATPSSH